MADIALLGIRHHGPGSARSVRRALDEFAPDSILLEAPAEADELLGFVGHFDMAPPVAMLAYVTDRPERAAFYPFAAFSPEWAALTWAAERGVPVRCMDLPAAVSFATPEGRGPGVDPIGALAEAAGYDDAEQWWEDVVEHRGHGAGTALDGFAAIAEAMIAIRADAPAATGQEAMREATMRQSMRKAYADGFDRVAVVCGAWHVPALSGALGPAAPDAALLKGAPKAKVTMTWVPWTHRRLASGTGYGAGVRSPGWYAHVYTHPGEPGITRWFARVAELLRAADVLVSPDHLIAASRLATSLAAMRSRPHAGLGEVMDSARAVLTEGRTGPIALIHERLVVGDELGTVPDAVPIVPLARDLAGEQKRVRLKPEAIERVLELDLRAGPALERSKLLHRLWILDVPWGVPEESRKSTGTFRETWRLRWEPELSVRLIEASASGTTVAAAAEHRAIERADAAESLADLTALIEVVVCADLAGASGPIIHRVANRAAIDADIAHLMDAFGPLARAVRYGDVRGSDATTLQETVDGLAVRICAGLAPAFSSFDDDAAPAWVDRLAATHAALGLIEHRTLDDLWPRALEVVAAQHGGHGLIRGRAARLLLDSAVWELDRASAVFARMLGRGTPTPVGAAFVEGFVAGSATVLLHDRRLLGLLDDWLVGMPAEVFDEVVPLLRRTFGAFDVSERRQLGQLVAGSGDGRAPAPFGWDLDPDRVEAGLATVRVLLGAST